MRRSDHRYTTFFTFELFCVWVVDSLCGNDLQQIIAEQAAKAQQAAELKLAEKLKQLEPYQTENRLAITNWEEKYVQPVLEND